MKMTIAGTEQGTSGDSEVRPPSNATTQRRHGCSGVSGSAVMNSRNEREGSNARMEHPLSGSSVPAVAIP